jgi:hypothetical protein
MNADQYFRGIRERERGCKPQKRETSPPKSRFSYSVERLPSGCLVYQLSLVVATSQLRARRQVLPPGERFASGRGNAGLPPAR